MQQNDLISLRRDFDILFYRAALSETSSFTDIRTALGLGKATSHRFLWVLEDLELLREPEKAWVPSSSGVSA